jgi:hypothetical protein
MMATPPTAVLDAPVRLRKPSEREYPAGTPGRCPECGMRVVYEEGAWFDPGTDFLHVTRNGTGVLV